MTTSAQTFEELVQLKIWLLYDFHYLLFGKKKEPDPREERVRKMLHACGNENRINSLIRGLHIGDYTLDEILEKKGFAK